MKKLLLISVGFFLAANFMSGFSQDLKPKKNNRGKYGYADKRDSVIIPYQFSDAEDFSEGMAAVKLEGKWGFIDKTGKVVINPQFDLTYYFSDGFCPVKKSGKWYFINKKGKKAINENYLLAFSFTEGYAAVKTETGWGYIDKEGQYAIKPEYEEAWSFSDGMANVRDGGLWGYINKQGDVVIEFKYDEAQAFSKGLATVKLNGKYFQIDKKGKKYVPPKDEETDDPNMIYTIVEQRPEFPGGIDEMMKFIQSNIQYPPEEKQNKLEGLVIVSVVVTKEGNLKDYKVIQGNNQHLNDEAIRVVMLMPKWIPGKNKGKEVNVQTTIPVRFRLSNK